MDTDTHEVRWGEQRVDDKTRAVVDWLESNVGGSVTEIWRQPRWRPVWFADLERDGETLSLCVRGEREDTYFGFSLDHEMRFQKCLEECGIPVAHVYGWIDAPRAYVMDRIPGSNNFEGVGKAELDAVMDDYMEVLARVHALPLETFERAGILRAEHPDKAATIGMETYEKAYRDRKVQPDPFLEFCLGWLKRNPLDSRGRETPIVWDSGQFHHQNGRISALMDLENGHIGDPVMDLATFRMRDTILGYGDFRRIYAHYEKVSGLRLDLRALQHHLMAMALCDQLAYHTALADPPPGADFMTNMQWCSETNLFALEVLAEMLGLELEPVEEIEVTGPPSSGHVAHSHLGRSLRNLQAGDSFTQHEIRIAFRLARHLQRCDEIGGVVEQANLEDLGELLGRRPANWQEGDTALERFVFEDGGANDTELIQLLHRRLQRYRMLMGPPGSSMVRHNPMQPFETPEAT
ncbi:phosphotransferase family protein [Myxococcota bacterium]|nr:phosphotransferase family protein [Myxococcota bacterium]